MPTMLGFDVSVVMEGKKLAEYQTEVSASAGVPVVICWVPSEAGKRFSVNIVPPPVPRKSHWKFNVSFDGLKPKVKGNILKKDKGTTNFTMASELVAERRIRDFQFSAIQLTDDDSVLHDVNPQLGEISLLLKSFKSMVPKAGPTGVSNSQTTGPIHEKMKKGLTHCVSFGPEKRFKPGQSYHVHGTRLAGKVIFKYRTLEYLAAQGIAPRDALPATPQSKRIRRGSGPGPSSSSRSRKRKAPPEEVKSEVDVDEELRLMEREKALEAELTEVRAKRSSARGSSARKKAKTEVKPEPMLFVHGEVIDLTTD